MFWPPSNRANNKVTISDAKFVADGEGAARHEPYVMDATFLAPWLSWDDDEGPWLASNPMCRVLLLGESGIQLRAMNTDTCGSILQLTSTPLGLQLWEVVSFFDWYIDGETDKQSAFCWCRLWNGEGDEGGGGGEGELSVEGYAWHVVEAFEPLTDAYTWTLGEEESLDGDGLLVIMVAYEGIAALASLSVDGEPASPVVSYDDSSGPTGLVVQCWMIPVSGGVGGIEFGWSDDTVTSISVTAMVVVNATSMDISTGSNNGALGGDIQVTADGVLSEAIECVVCFAAMRNPSTTPIWDEPVGATGTPNASGPPPGYDTRDGYRFTTGIETPTAIMTGITADNYIALIASFF